MKTLSRPPDFGVEIAPTLLSIAPKPSRGRLDSMIKKGLVGIIPRAKAASGVAFRLNGSRAYLRTLRSKDGKLPNHTLWYE